MKSDNITIFLEIFNEEERIGDVLENFKWAKEVVVLDKTSNDKSVKIALKYTEKVFCIPYSDVSDHSIDFIKNYRTHCEWYFFITASSLISPNLVEKIIRITNDRNFKNKVIALPFKIYILGINSKYSPWNRDFKEVLIRKDALILNKRVHGEIGHSEEDVFKIEPSTTSGYFYHCSNQYVDELLKKHMRYAKNEVLQAGLSTKKTRFDLMRAIARIILKKRTYRLGENGIALSFGFLSYYVLRYLYAWELNKNNSEDYSKIRDKLHQEWVNRNENNT